MPPQNGTFLTLASIAVVAGVGMVHQRSLRGSWAKKAVCRIGLATVRAHVENFKALKREAEGLKVSSDEYLLEKLISCLDNVEYHYRAAIPHLVNKEKLTSTHPLFVNAKGYAAEASSLVRLLAKENPYVEPLAEKIAEASRGLV